MVDKTLDYVFLLARDRHVEGCPAPTIDQRVIVAIVACPKSVLHVKTADKHVVKVERVHLGGAADGSNIDTPVEGSDVGVIVAGDTATHGVALACRTI